MNPEPATLVVGAMRLEAREVMSFELVAPDGTKLPAWTAGAHVDVEVPGIGLRQYSLCGDPADRSRFRIAVLREHAGRGGSKYLFDVVRPGGTLRVGAPRNHFALEPAPEYLFVAGGIGITPILPMVAAAEQAGIPFRLVYGGRTRSAMAFVDEVASHGDRVEVVPQDRLGLIDLDLALGRLAPAATVYCCGPAALLAAVESAVHARPGLQLRTERFTAAPATTTRTGEDGAFDLVLARSGRRVRVPAERSLLDVLRESGVNVPSACEEGVCGSCETAVLAGEPEHRDSILNDREREESRTMFPCVSRARSAELELDL